MATNQQLWLELKTTFELDLSATAQLLDLLQREREALEQRNYTEFQQLIPRKQTLLTQLEQHSTKRILLLKAAGFSDESSTLDAAEQQAPIVAKAWRKLALQWRDCQQRNEINERIAKRTRLVVGQILDMLRGQNNQARLYSANGTPRPSSGGNNITSV